MPRGRSGGLLVVAGILLTACTTSTRIVGHPRPQAVPAAPSTTTTLATTTSSGAAPSTSVAASTTAPSNAVDRAIAVYGDCTHPSVEPSEIVMACADYGAVAEDLRWSAWTSSVATAVGTIVYKTCAPDCATGGSNRIENDRITLSSPVVGRSGQLVWSEIQEDPEPPGYSSGPFGGGAQPLPTGPD
jgi:hypothetical protein